MSQNFNDISSTTGAADSLPQINSNFDAIRTRFAGPTAPSNPKPYDQWLVTTSGILTERNAANTAWITINHRVHADGSTPTKYGGNQRALWKTVGNSGTSQTIDWSAGTRQHVTLNGNCDFTFTGGEPGEELILALKQDATGSRTVTWQSNHRFSGGTAPTLTTAAAKTDYLKFIYNSVDSKYDLVETSLNF